MDVRAVRRNTRLCQLFEMLWPMYFGTATLVEFYKLHGLDQQKINALQSIIAIVALLGEIPAGYLADRFGIRHVIIIGAALQVTQAILFWRCQVFWQFEVVVAMTGLAGCMLSGTTRALVTTTLQSTEVGGRVISVKTRARVYARFVSYATMNRCAGQLSGILIGGYVATRFNLDIPRAIQPIAYLIGAIAAWRVIGTPKHLTESRRVPLESIWETPWMMLKKRTDIRCLIAVVVTLNVSILSSYWLLQPAMKNAGIPVSLFGVFFASSMCVTMGFAKTIRYLRRLDDMTAFAILIGVMVVTTAIAGLSESLPGVVTVFFGYAFVGAFAGQLGDIWLHKLLHDSDTRTCEQSVIPMLKSLVFSGVSMILGWVVVHFSVGAAFFVIAGMCLCCGGVALAAFRKAIHNNE